MSFLDSIDKYRSIYFHFLDGLLNTISGGYFINVISTLNDIIPGLLPEDITFGVLTQIYFNSNLFSSLDFINRNSILYFKHDEEETNQISLDMFKFCIISMGYNSHRTTTIIFTKGIEMYLYILNTGLDMEVNGKSANINNQVLYQLTKGIILCDDIHDKTKLDRTYKFIKNFFFISWVYNQIKQKKYSQLNWNTEFNRRDYIYTDEFKKSIHILSLSDIRPIFDKIFKFNNSDVNLQYFLNNLNTVYDKEFTLEINDNYYILVSAFIDKNPLINIGKIRNINQFNVYNQNVIPRLKRDKLSESFIKKIILYNQNDNLYIFPQESGSCTWYSIYFSILLYYVIHDELSNYIKFINKINDKFYNYLLRVYTKDNFIQVLENDKNNYIYMKQLCSKLIDIKLIDNSILYDNLDTIYETEFTLNLTRNNTLSYNYELKMPILSEDTSNNSEIIKNLIINVLPLEMNPMYSGNKFFQTFFCTAYDIYFKKRNNFFKHHIDLTKIKEKINLPFKQRDDGEFEEFIDPEKIINLLMILEETYLIQLGEYVPSYLTYYIPIILYINSSFDNQINLNFTDGRENLYNCCLLFFRLYIIGYIIHCFCNEMFLKNKKFKIEILYDLIDNLIVGGEGERLKDYDTEITKEIIKRIYANRPNPFDSDYIPDFLEIFYEEKISIQKFDLFDNFMEKFDILTDIEKFVFNNKKFITNQFLVFNINRINQFQKEELIDYYCNICYNFSLPFLTNYNEETKLGNINLEIVNHIESLYILLFGCPVIRSPYNLCIKFFTLDLTYFAYIIDKIKNKTDSKNKFKDILINQKDIIFEDEFKIIPDYVYKNTQINFKQFTKNYINYGIFNHKDSYKTNLLVQDNINQNSEFDIYQIFDVNYIRYKCLCITNNQDFKFRILEIYVNGNKVIKFKDIIYPFKYLIPNTDINLIYKENGVYNIAYNFFNSLREYNSYLLDSRLLGTFNLKDYHIYQINPNNQFFLNKFSSNSSFKNWNLICLNYQVNGYNILYTNLNATTTDTNGYSVNKKYASIYNFDKKSIFEEEICYDLTDFNLLNPKSVDHNLLEFIIDDKNKDSTESYKKLLFKISKCNINETNKLEWIHKFSYIIEELKDKIKRFTELIKNLCLGDLLTKNNYPLLQSYLLNIKILNFIKKILANINDNKNLCSIIKNYNNLFNTKQNPLTYKFEILFEIINGNEILKEQMERYEIMIDSYNNYNNIQKGNGRAYVHNSPPEEILEYDDDLTQNDTSLIDTKMHLEYKQQQLSLCKSSNYYPLHHFMMGKGKSAIITPLLSFYFNIIKKQFVYIIVPKHLVKQTQSTLQDYIDIFQIKNIIIKSEDDIKKDFLDEIFNVKNNNIIFLIDEFDSLINPLKSNFNYIKEVNESLDFSFIKDIRTFIFNIINMNYNNKEQIKLEIRKYPKIVNKEFVVNNILSIIEQIKNEEIKFNINWGIDSDELLAIPFRSKDKPIKNSSFTSIIKTLFLSYYYYINIKKYIIDDIIYKYILNNYSVFIEFFRKPIEELTKEYINEYTKNRQNKDNFFNLFFNEIFNKIKLPTQQYNTSFVDIINIDNIFKIGYSGTININLPNIQNLFKFTQECKYPDDDESNNIEYAIINSKILKFNMENYLNNLVGINALIDVCGYFYNQSNIKIASDLNEKLQTNIIFIDEKDDKMVITEDGKLEKLNENKIYSNPFFYYDQAHIVGIDIKQDNYPILHGLCIVDNLSYYSEVAQAMFRLRKLNFGHEISFILHKFNINKQKELLDHFRINEKNLIEQQKNNLNLQALKSDIRKKRSGEFIKRYKEDLYYYFIMDFPSNPLSLIFNKKEIDDVIKILNLYELKLDDIREIIYDLDFKSSKIQHQVINQQNTEVHLQMQMQIQTQESYRPNLNPDLYEIFRKYLFKNFDFIKNIRTIQDYNLVTFEIDDIISFLPNIFFSNHSDYRSNIAETTNNVNNNLLFVYIHTVGKFILIPIFMVVYLYDNFMMLDLNFNIINKIEYKNDVKIKELEKNKFVKIITNKYTNEEIDIYYREFNECCTKRIYKNIHKYIFSFLISRYLLNLWNLVRELKVLENRKKYENIYKAILDIEIYHLMDIIQRTIDFNKHDHLIRKLKISVDSAKRKYLKYKAKYFNLKKMLQ